MEGVTFRTPRLSAVLRDRVVESRLHMDFPGRIEREQWVEQAKAIVGR